MSNALLLEPVKNVHLSCQVFEQEDVGKFLRKIYTDFSKYLKYHLPPYEELAYFKIKY